MSHAEITPRNARFAARRGRGQPVQKTITAAIDRISTVNEPLARHVRVCVHTGLMCTYEPDPATPFTWVCSLRTSEPRKVLHPRDWPIPSHSHKNSVSRW